MAVKPAARLAYWLATWVGRNGVTVRSTHRAHNLKAAVKNASSWHGAKPDAAWDPTKVTIELEERPEEDEQC